MRKIIVTAMVSLDGFFEGPGEGYAQLDWHALDQEWGEYSVDVLQRAEVLLFGRRTFENFAGYWPKQEGAVAERINTMPKLVCSRTRTHSDWPGSRFIRGDVPAEIARLKAEPGGVIQVFASANLCETLTAFGLVDQYRIAVAPVVLGAGRPFFAPGRDRLHLALEGTRVFRSGLVELRYTPQS